MSDSSNSVEPDRTGPGAVLLSRIAARLNLPAPAREISITGIASLGDAGPTEISFLNSDAYVSEFAATKAAAVLVQKSVKIPPGTPTGVGGGSAVLVVDKAELALAVVLELFSRPVPRPVLGIDPSAFVDPSAQVGSEARIGRNVVIGAHARIGRGVVIHPGVFIGEEVILGDQCELFPHVTLRERITLGSRVTIHANTVLGTDGFGYAWDGIQHAKVPQIGTIIVEDDVEIGSCVCVDRAKFSVTRIGRGTKIDNLVQIAHNVVIGPASIIVAQVGIAGSTTLGAGVMLGGQAAIKDHIHIGDGSIVAACAAVLGDLPPKSAVSGMPAFPHRQSLREQAHIRRLPALADKVKELEGKIAELKAELLRHLKP